MKEAYAGFLRRPAVAGVLQCVVLFAILAGLRQAGMLQSLELLAYDRLLRLSAPATAPDPRIALVTVTESDIRRLGHWPLTDGALAGILATLQSYRPDAIGVDVYRDLPVPPGSAALDAALTGMTNVFMVEKFGAGGAAGVPPPPVLAHTERTGFSDLVMDPDGVVRRGLLFLDDGEQVHHALSLRLALHYLQGRGVYPAPGADDPAHLRLGTVTLRPLEGNDGGYVRADAGGYQYLLDYRGGARPFATYTLAQLQSGAIPADALRDRVVLVGVAADSVKDDFLTPYGAVDARPGVPGSVLHAHATGQLLRMALDGERPLVVIDDALEYAWILLWTAAGIVVAMLFRSLVRLLPVLLGGTALLLLTVYAAFLQGLWLPAVPAGIGWLSAATLMTAWLVSHEAARRRQVMELFSRQVSPDIAREIWRQRDHFLEGGRMPARRVVATVLACDLEDFTPVAERLGPGRLMDWLNRYMETMAGLVLQHDGIVDDYYGDAIMADFGVPLPRDSEVEQSRDACNAVDCALAMRTALAELNAAHVHQDLPPVRMRVGIATGTVVAGFLGTARRMKYTTVGDTVNTAARLESYGKQLPPGGEDEGGCRILVSADTASRLGDGYRLVPVGELSLKGKQQAVPVFSVLSGGAS